MFRCQKTCDGQGDARKYITGVIRDNLTDNQIERHALMLTVTNSQIPSPIMANE